MSKRCDVTEAIGRIPDGATVVIGGTGVAQEPDLLLAELERQFLETGHPRDLTVLTPMLPGDGLGEGGLNAIAHEGLLKKIIGASFSRPRHEKLLDLIRAEKCEGYIAGMGTMVQLMTAAGSGKPGVFTKAGIGSFMDPREAGGGGAMNARSTDLPVEVMEIAGEDWLFYPVIRPDVALIRGTTADEAGYVSMEEEPNTLGMVEYALGTKNSGGRVIVQVKREARGGSLDPRTVRIPGPLIDDVVVHPHQTQLTRSMQDPLDGWSPFLAGALKAPTSSFPPVEAGARRMILRRAALELQADDVVNLGAGAATHLPRILHEEGCEDRVIFTNEHGIFGGLMGTVLGGSFVPALNAEAIMDSGFQFNFYDGGGLDVTFLGIGEVDAKGNLNVSRFGAEINGPGGFNNIIEKTPRIVFCGTLTAGGLRVSVTEGRLSIDREGRFPKFVEAVEQVTFNGPRAQRRGQSVKYITERAVFELREEGPVLTEVAPGINIETQIAPHVGFRLRVAEDLKEMPAAVFGPEPLGLPARLAPRKGED